ncbi:MAG: glutathione peroxidase [Imperialibacter sp.]|uniref:glutathione peroxidase n=1 Tax=Imperialibacter sp. TaxID=2038411 RepID=UPI003A8ACD4A
MKKLLYLLIFITSTAMAQGSFYDFKMASIDGETIDFSKYKGQKVLIVNTASECGYTPQYEDLQALHEQFGGKMTVLGFPANNFGGQEPGSNLQIAQFCKKNYGVSFQLFEKIDVIGKDRAPLYAWLEKQSGKVPTWNFCKYLIDENGKVVQFFPSAVNPMDEQVTGLL